MSGVNRRYIHGEMTTGEFQVSEGGYSVQLVDDRAACHEWESED